MTGLVTAVPIVHISTCHIFFKNYSTNLNVFSSFQVLASKEIHAAGLKRRLGITAWREFSEDMQQGLKSISETQAYKKTAEGLTAVKSKTASAWYVDRNI